MPEGAPPGTRRGRVSADLLHELIPDPTAVLIYACGPALSSHDRAAAREKGVEPTPRFMETVSAAVKEIGVPKERYKTEAYGYRIAVQLQIADCRLTKFTAAARICAIS